MTFTETYPDKKPDKVQAISIITLVSGIFNILYAVGFAFGLLVGALGTFGATVLCLPITILPLVVGILEIIAASKLLKTPPRHVRLQTIAILEIVTIISLNPVSLVAGILNLVFYNEPETKHYIDSLPF